MTDILVIAIVCAGVILAGALAFTILMLVAKEEERNDV